MRWVHLFLTLYVVVGKKVIAVIGATGAQGGGVVDAILKDGTFACRALTRSVSSEKARALAGRGCEVVEGDVDKPETLKRAFKGAEGAFVMTDVGQDYDEAREYRQAVGAADAAHEAGVKHIVWSTLEDVDLHDNFRNVIPKIGDSKLPHFAAKAKASRYMKSKFYPVTHLYLPMFMENFETMHWLSRVDDSHYEYVLPSSRPDTKYGMVSMHDVGLAVLDAFLNPASSINQDLRLMGDLLTAKEMASSLEQAIGVKVTVKQPEPLKFGQSGFPFAREMANLFLYVSEYNDIHATYQRTKGYQTFETFLKLKSQVLKEYISKENKAAQAKKQDL